MKRLFCLLIASLLLFSSCFDGREHLQNDPSDTSEKYENNEESYPYREPEPRNPQKIEGKVYTENGLMLELKEDGTYEVADIGVCSDVDLVIPSHHEGIPITSIYNLAFMFGDFIENITLPSTLTEVGSLAFIICPKLNFNIYNGVKYLGNPENPYEYLIEPQNKDTITSHKVHKDTRVITDSAFMRCDNLKSVTFSDGIEVLGAQAFCQTDTLESVYLGKSLRYIGRLAFQHCNNLKSIDLPDTVEYIGREAFFVCNSIESIEIPNGVKVIEDETFAACRKLSSLKLGNSIESIGEMAFRDCTSLTDVELPETLKVLGEQAFAGCRKMKRIVIHDGVEEIYASSFPKDIGFGNWYEGLRYVGNDINPYIYVIGIAIYNFRDQIVHKDTKKVVYGALLEDASIKTLGVEKGSQTFIANGSCLIEKDSGRLVCGIAESKIPTDGSVKSIGKYAFANNTKITSISIPKSVKSIEDYAFYNCTSLSDVEFLEGLAYIGSSAFEECAKLKSVVLPNTLKSVGDRAFYFCEAVEELDLGNSVESIGRESFANLAIKSLIIPSSLLTVTERSFRVCRDIETLTFEGSGKIIEGAAFSAAEKLESLDLSAVDYIGNHAFGSCYALTEVKFSDTLEVIGPNAFYGCTSLAELVIPESVKEIGSGAFTSCGKLTSINIPENIERFGQEVFLYTSISTVKVPKCRTELYENDFSGCYDLTEVYIHSGITSIGDGVFYQCKNLRKIYFDGTVEEWNAIEKHKLWNRCTYGITVVCTDGEIEVPEDNTEYESMLD